MSHANAATPIVADDVMILHHEEATVEDPVLPIACGVHPEAGQAGEVMAIATTGIETGIAIATDITMKDQLPVVVVPPHEMTTVPVVEDVTGLPVELDLPWDTVHATITEQLLLVVATAAAVVLDHDHPRIVPPVVLLVVTMEEVDRMNIEIDECHLLDLVQPGVPKAIVIEVEVQNAMSTEEMIVDIAHEPNTKGRKINMNRREHHLPVESTRN